jgi:predicted nucleic acid-binding protein
VSLEFIDTNVQVCAHERDAGLKHSRAVELVSRLVREDGAALSIQVLAEFYATAVRKLGMSSQEAEAIVSDFGVCTIHRPGHADLLQAARLHRRYRLSWWDALILNSALDLGCSRLWTEDFTDGRRFGPLTVRNPFRHRDTA